MKIRYVAVTIDQGAVRGNIQAQEQWIRPGQFLSHEIRQQGIVRLAAVTFGTGAGDHPVHAQPLKLSGLAGAVSHFDSLGVFGICLDAAGMDFDLSVLNLRSKRGADRRRDPVTMHIPVGAHVAQETASLTKREGTPDFLREGTKGVNHGAPAAACFFRGLPLRANQAQESANRSGRLLGPEWRPRSSRFVSLW